MSLKTRLTSCAAAIMMTVASSQVAHSQSLQVNFRDTDIREVINFVSGVTEKTIIVDPLVNGRVMVVSDKPIDADELYNLFLSVLEVHNYIAVENNGVVRVIPKSKSRSTAVMVEDGITENNAALTTQVIPVGNVSATQLLAVLRPLVPPESHIAAYEPSNSVVITDTAANVSRIRDLIQRFDDAAVESSEVVTLKYANAQVMEKLVRSAIVGETPVPGMKMANVVADTRTNSLLVTGDPLARDRVKSLIARLDTESGAEAGNRVIYLDYADAAEVAEALVAIAPKAGEGATVTVHGDNETNSVVISGDPTQISTLTSIAKQLDVEREQVLVEAIIVELSDTAGKELGVQWLFANTGSGSFGSSANGNNNIGGVIGDAVDSSGNFSVSDLGAGLAAVNGQTLGIAGVTGNLNFSVLINALQDVSGANVLSTPSVMTMDNREATIESGQEVPIVTGSYTSQGNASNPGNPFQTIDRKDVGVMLKVTPRISAGDKIVLDIEQEVSSIAQDVAASDVVTNNRNIQTQVVADDGAVVVLGGLIKEDLQQYEQKVPLLGDIPLLGRLFRSNTSKLVKSNLVVFIRATKLANSADIEAITKRQYELARKDQVAMPDLDPTFLDDREKPELKEFSEEQGEH